MSFSTSKQQPLSAARGRSAHDFTQSYTDWEGAVFDNAAYFAVIELRGAQSRSAGPRDRKYTKFRYFPWAVRYATPKPDACVYTVTQAGRFNFLDREKWDEWMTRWWSNRDDKKRDDTEEHQAVPARPRFRRADDTASDGLGHR